MEIEYILIAILLYFIIKPKDKINAYFKKRKHKKEIKTLKKKENKLIKEYKRRQS